MLAEPRQWLRPPAILGIRRVSTRDHLGEGGGKQVKKNEQVITQVEFVSITELKAKREQMETWSQLCLDNLDAFLKR